MQKGLNFAPAPTSFLLQDTIADTAGTEEVARKLPTDDAQDLRMHVCRILRSSHRHHKAPTGGFEGNEGLRFLGHPAGGQGEQW